MKTYQKRWLWLLVSLSTIYSGYSQYATVGIIGSATPSGWEASTPMTQSSIDSNLWVINDFVLTDGETKFQADDDWAINWGGVDFPYGYGTQGGQNIPTAAGTYDILLHTSTGEYLFVAEGAATYSTIGLIGSATAVGWDASTPLNQSPDSPHLWHVDNITLSTGEAKFRANDEWAVNWGNTDFPTGIGLSDGANIPIPAGDYEVSFNDLTGRYQFTSNFPVYHTVGIIGSATPSGWDASTPMNSSIGDPHQWTLTTSLTAGELKFRADDDWTVNWGGTDFPTGDGLRDGSNITVLEGDYTIAFNDRTGRYNFQDLSGGEERLVTLSPLLPTADEAVTLIYDASKGSGGLVGEEKVYLHTGVVVSGPEGRAWTNVVGNYGQDDGIGQMTPVPGEPNKWQFTYPTTIRDYYGVAATTPVFRLAMVFRNANGTAEGKTASGGDIYLNINPGNYIRFVQPSANDVFTLSGEPVTIVAEASDIADTLALIVNGVPTVSNSLADSIAYSYHPTASETLHVRVAGVVNGDSVSAEKSIAVNVRPPNTIAPIPEGMQEGINYLDDPTRVVLVLTAPGKSFVYAVGDFSNWQVQPSYQMNQTPDGEKFWVALDGLTPGQEYIYQYWVEGIIKIGDPFADKVVDPFNDSAIPNTVYPDLIPYHRTQDGIATVFQTDQTPYSFMYPEPVGGRPAKEDLVIYELLVRDFIASHSYSDLIDTLDYIQRLGANAIELMPIMEFEGNESWGYNPSYLLAPDKYYGTKNDLKRFIDAAHARGIVVLADIVLNHQFGQSPMVQMYFDADNSRPAPDNPWFNVEATHPFNVGFDMNHESPYVKDYIDLVNRYWVEEYEVDGYRFDLSKGFTQNVGKDPTDVGGWSSYDQSRIDILIRMANEIWAFNPDTYVILEHLGANDEETVLANYGMMLWGNMNHNYRDLVNGNTQANLDGVRSETKGWNDRHLIAYMESHDEERLVHDAITNGSSSGNYNVRDTIVALERAKLASAFYYTVPGPKMLWQFGELGYDFSINFNSRIGNKPIPWGDPDGLDYHLDPDRQKLYKVKSAIINLVKEHRQVFNEGAFNWTPSGKLRELTINHTDMNVVIIGNVGLTNGTMTPSFAQTGTWFDFFTGSPIDVADDETIELNPGEFHLYTDQPVNFPETGLVRTFEPIVSIAPESFTQSDRVQLTFNAAAADGAGTAGLVNAEKVYLYAGAVTEGPDGTTWSYVTGTENENNGIGAMTRDPDHTDQWLISFRPDDYFDIPDGETLFRIGMYFRNADGSLVGKAPGGQPVYIQVAQPQEIVTIDPEVFDADTEIQITFDALKADPAGTSGLIGEDKVYLHAGVVLTDTESPTGSDWARVIGNWGQDDGIGAMSPAAGVADRWEITLTPRSYFSMAPADSLFYLAMVFRNASGTAEGKGVGGTDIFMEANRQEELVAAPGNLTLHRAYGAIEVFWKDSADNELGFILERSVGTSSDFRPLAYLPPDTDRFTDTEIIDGTTYRYRVQATNAQGADSGYSNVGTLSIPLAAPSDLEAGITARRYIQLNWVDNSQSETGYLVQRAMRSGRKRGRFRTIATLPVDATNYQDVTCASRGTYYYRVAALQDSSLQAFSEELAINTRKRAKEVVTFGPNPANRYVNFQLRKDYSGRVDVTIRNAYGWPVDRLRFRKKASRSLMVNTANYPEGLYLVDISFDGTRVVKRLYVRH